MNKFDPGDTVQMKSGGPIMTVASIDDDGRCVCHWFNDKNENKVGAFPQTVLERYEF